MKTILIAGGGGFIGLNLTKRLLTIGDPDIQIVILDNFKTSSRKNLEKICGDSSPERIDVFDVDITKASELDFLKTMYTCITEIYHLASIASPVGYSQFPLETLEAGYTGTKNLLDLAASLDSKPRFLFASSSEVYGQPLVHPQPESYYGNVNPYGTRSCYDTSKRVGETLVWIYHNTSTEGDGNRPCSGDLRSTLPPTDSVDTRIVRIFNTYGPYMSLNDGRIVTEIIKAAINGTVLKIFGDGNQTRCFSYIDDTIDSILTVMESNYTDPVNVGNDSKSIG
jgi:UDP-glucuronate decarboxylase